MSANIVLNAFLENGLDLSGFELDNFISCIKYLNKLFQDKKIKAKNVRYTSELNKVMTQNDIYTNKVSDLYHFDFRDVTIQIVIYQSNFYVAITGDYRPKDKTIGLMLQNYEFNFDTYFDFPDVGSFKSVNAASVYYGGKDFPLTPEGFGRIHHLFCVICTMCLNEKDKKYVF